MTSRDELLRQMAEAMRADGRIVRTDLANARLSWDDIEAYLVPLVEAGVLRRVRASIEDGMTHTYVPEPAPPEWYWLRSCDVLAAVTDAGREEKP